MKKVICKYSFIRPKNIVLLKVLAFGEEFVCYREDETKEIMVLMHSIHKEKVLFGIIEDISSDRSVSGHNVSEFIITGFDISIRIHVKQTMHGYRVKEIDEV